MRNAFEFGVHVTGSLNFECGIVVKINVSGELHIAYSDFTIIARFENRALETSLRKYDITRYFIVTI